MYCRFPNVEGYIFEEKIFSKEKIIVRLGVRLGLNTDNF
jgi:hypothetical protein